VRADVTKLEDAEQMAQAALDKFGKIDILVNNAGVWVFRLFKDTSKETWDEDMGVCYYGVLNCTKAVLNGMIERKSGSIVNISSDAGRIGEIRQPVYSGAKAGVIGFTKALAKEVGPYGIRVNAICPSMTETEGAAETIKLNEEQKAKVLKLYPLRKVGNRRIWQIWWYFSPQSALAISPARQYPSTADIACRTKKEVYSKNMAKTAEERLYHNRCPRAS
jgi:NAD(P)-dependent dehydrogenase (short-subunit alcohol dehydrogenase family)